MVDKVFASPEQALDDLHDGASIAVSGFGTSYGFACSLLVAARDKGVKNLTLVSNGLGTVGQLRGILLVASGQVRKLIVSFSSRPGMRTPADDLIEAGDVEMRGSSRNFNPAVAKAALVAIAEVDEIVEVCQIDPERV